MSVSVSRASVASEGSLSLESWSTTPRSDSSADVEQNINELTESEIMAIIEKKRKSIKRLETENRIFQTQLEVFGESSTQTADISMKRPSFSQKSFGSTGSFLTLTSTLGERRARSAGSAVSHSFAHKGLSMANKYYVVKTELNKLKFNNKLENKEREKLIEDIQNNIEETDMCTADTIQQDIEFEQKIIVGGKHPVTSNVKAEKLLHYFENKQKSQAIVIQNLRMKTTKFQALQKELIEASKMRTEVVRDVRKVDIDQRKIQVMQGQKEIQIQNEHRLRMKSMAARAKQILDEKLARLGELTKVDNSVRQRHARKRGFVEKLNSSINEVEKEVQAYEQEYSRLNRELKDYCPITAFDIMKLKDALKSTERIKKDWHRHANVVKLKTKFAKKERNPEDYT